ncbi:hypothetical protein M4Z11_07290, partial [Bartonella sp. G70]|nr:hypothetical protein [Bartonella sp. G70]
MKAASLGTVMTVLLSSVSPVIASTFSPVEIMSQGPDLAFLNIKASDHDEDNASSSALLAATKEQYEKLLMEALPNVGGDYNFYVSGDYPINFTVNSTVRSSADNPRCIKQPGLIGCYTDGLALGDAIQSDEGSITIGSGVAIGGTGADIVISGHYVLGEKASAISNAIAIGRELVGERLGEPGTQAISEAALADSPWSVAIGTNTKVSAGTDNSVALGMNAKIGIGSSDSVALGHSTNVGAGSRNSVALGSSAKVGNNSVGGIAIGNSAQANVVNGVALGAESVADVKKGVVGYKPGSTASKDDFIWTGTSAAVSVGNVVKKITRQIVGVAAGTQDTDAVNVAQLKSLQELVTENTGGKGWKLSVGGQNTTDVEAGGTVDFSSTGNLQISKDEKNKVTFDLAKSITVDKLTVAGHILDKGGLILKDGPSMTVMGINAADKKITGVADGMVDSDAANIKQLNAVENLAKNGWKLLVPGGKSINVGAGSELGFFTGSENLSIVVSDQGAITFDLAKKITADAITVGKNILNENGLQIKDKGDVLGPAILVSGISAGNKKITGVLVGTEDTDAVNFSQLKAVKNELEKNNWIQQDSATGVITIGAQAGGEAINLANKEKKGRTLSGLKDGEVSTTSTAAITGGQLYALNQQLADYFGGGAGYGANGWTDPKFEVVQFNFGGKAGEKTYDTYNNVADAFGGVNKSMENLNNRIDSVEKQTEQNGLNWDEDKGAYDARRKDEKGNLATSTITGVKDGEISKGS